MSRCLSIDTSNPSSHVDDDATISSLDELIITIATSLMGVSSENAPEAVTGALRILHDYFKVDHVVLRSHDHEAGLSIMVDEFPVRQDVPSPDPLAVVPFASDPVFAPPQHLPEPMVVYPSESEEYDERVSDATGQAATLAGVPIRNRNENVGFMALVRSTDPSIRWQDDEVKALFAIATMFAQLWGRLEAEETVRRQAFHDSMTDLPNRRNLTETLSEIETGIPVSLLMLDIDNMKVINDGLDFETGNQFILALVKRLCQSVRPTDVVARLQGDQFVVLITGEGPEAVTVVAERLVEELSNTLDVCGMLLARSVSIGVAHTTDLPNCDLFGEADAALHQAKLGGKKRAVLFDEQMRSRVLDRFATEIELRRALDNNELELHYQPSVDLNTGDMKAVEALIRWNHPTKGLLNAGLFIDAAEQAGLMVEIGEFVIDRATKQLAEWHKEKPELEMWINISPAHLMMRNIAEQISGAIARNELSSSKVCIEVTEHSVLEDLDFACAALEKLRSIGVEIALDDFGTGYSSMKQLKSLPVTHLKIDMAFVAGLGVSKYDSAIVDASITLADAFGLRVVAEGVEEAHQIAELVSRGCNLAQGYLLARPMSASKVAELLHTSLLPTEAAIAN